MRVTLLLSDHPQAEAAWMHAREMFDVVQVQQHSRKATVIRDPIEDAEFLLNFLSAPRIPKNDLDRFRLALNFHPAPPEYPGVGSASIALFDKRTVHGVTCHVMTEEFDAGTILQVRRFKIEPEWGYTSLWERSLAESLNQFRQVCGQLADGIPLRKDWSVGWARKAYTRKEFEVHPSFSEVPA